MTVRIQEERICDVCSQGIWPPPSRRTLAVTAQIWLPPEPPEYPITLQVMVDACTECAKDRTIGSLVEAAKYIRAAATPKKGPPAEGGEGGENTGGASSR